MRRSLRHRRGLFALGSKLPLLTRIRRKLAWGRSWSNFCQFVCPVKPSQIPDIVRPKSFLNPSRYFDLMQNLTHLARSINSLIREKVCKNKQNGGLTVDTNTWKKVPTALWLWSRPIHWRRASQQIQVWPRIDEIFGRSPQERPQETDEEKT